MRILLDECISADLVHAFLPHEAVTVREAGLKGMKNGALLAAAENHFDCFFTVDRGIYYQQKHGKFSIRIICLQGCRNTLAGLLPHIGAVIAEFEMMKLGDVVLLDSLSL